MNLRESIKREGIVQRAITQGRVVPDPSRCVQCGICSFHCPISIDVRRHAWLGEPVNTSHCLTCGECVARCPRGVLRFERSHMFDSSNERAAFAKAHS